LHWAEQFYESSALPDLLSVPAEKVNEDRLYRRWMRCCRISQRWRNT